MSLPDAAPSRCYLGLGGNLGQPLALFDEVVNHFKQHPLAAGVKESPRYESAPVDATGPNYVNSVLQVFWRGTALQLLEACLNLEAELGRIRTTRNAPRPIDVDVLLVENLIIHTERLILPHPRMHLRRFVLEPLLQLDPTLHLPGLGPASSFLPDTTGQHVRPI